MYEEKKVFYCTRFKTKLEQINKRTRSRRITYTSISRLVYDREYSLHVFVKTNFNDLFPFAFSRIIRKNLLDTVGYFILQVLLTCTHFNYLHSHFG